MKTIAFALASLALCTSSLAFAAPGDTTTPSTKASDPKAGDAKPGEDKEEEGTIATNTNAPPETAGDPNEGRQIDVKEKDGKTYYFIGTRYRGTVVPQAFMSLFIDGGTTVWTNSAALEFDIRKDGFSIIPSLQFAEHGMKPTLFHEKGKDMGAGNWSVVASDLKGIYGAVDLLWSAKIAKNFDFEFGFGVGIGILMGDLINNWVTGGPVSQGAVGALRTNVGGVDYAFAACPNTAYSMGNYGGCSPANHQGKAPKVGARDSITLAGGYTEPGWTNGGSVPSIFPYIALPLLGLRIKPVKSLVIRVPQFAFTLTGFTFGITLYYGLEQAQKKAPTLPSNAPGAGPGVKAPTQ